MSKTLEQRIADIERRLSITTGTDCPEGYRELGEIETLIAGDIFLSNNGGFRPTIKKGNTVRHVRNRQSGGVPYRYFRKLAEPEQSAKNDQIAAVMLQHGTPDQQREALAYCGIQEPQDIPDGCLPFDLAKALAGHPVRTRSGATVSNFEQSDTNNSYPYAGSIEGRRRAFKPSGKRSTHCDDDLDLFLVAPKPSPREIVEELQKTYSMRRDSHVEHSHDWNHFQRKIDLLTEVLEGFDEHGY